MYRGMDSDNYDGDVPQSHFKRLYDLYQIRYNIIGLEARIPYANSQRRNCEAAGMLTPFAYKFLYWVPTDLENMKIACGFGKPIAIDCEYETNWTPSQVVERIWAARELLIREGLYWGIYTGAPWWRERTGNTSLFSADKLWHAGYPFSTPTQAVLPPVDWYPSDLIFRGNAFEGSINQQPYGGWTKADYWQYTNVCYDDNLGDWDFDMNMVPELPGPPSVPTEPPLWNPRLGVFDTIKGDLMFKTSTGIEVPLHFEGKVKQP